MLSMHGTLCHNKVAMHGTLCHNKVVMHGTLCHNEWSLLKTAPRQSPIYNLTFFVLQAWSLDTLGIILTAASLIFCNSAHSKTSALPNKNTNKQTNKQTNKILGLYEVGIAWFPLACFQASTAVDAVFFFILNCLLLGLHVNIGHNYNNSYGRNVWVTVYVWAAV